MTCSWSGRRFAAGALLAAAFAVLAFALLPRTGEAHAALVRANPANNETVRLPPSRVALTFSEPIERKLTQIKVLDADRTRVDEDDIAFDDTNAAFASVGVEDLAPGLYYVQWENVSNVDGHPARGVYPFIVSNVDGTLPAGVSFDNATGLNVGSGDLLPSNTDIALKWIALLSLAAVAGAALFLVVVIRPAAQFLEDADYHAANDAAERWVINLSHVLLPAAFIASAVLILITVNRFATGTSVWSYLTTVRTGEYRGVQLLLTAVALVGADVLFLGTTERRRHVGVALLITATAGALFMSSLVSHSANDEGKFWSIASDFAHLAASSAWLGALIVLPVLLLWVRGRFAEAQRFLYVANVFDRFSNVAGISVVVVLATGAFNGIAAVPNADAMVDTTYGRVLLAKIALLLPLLAVAGVNAFVLKPRLVSLIDGLYQAGGTADEGRRAVWRGQLTRLQRALPWTIAVEVVLVVAVFAAVGVLSQTSTAEGEIAQKEAEAAGGERFTQTADRDGLKVTLEVTPNRVGLNDYLVRVQRPDGTDVETLTRVRLRFTYDDPNSAVAPSELLLNRFGGGKWQAQGAYFSQRGNWRVDVGIRRSNGDDISQAFVLPVLPAPRTDATDGGTFDLPFTAFTWNEVVGVAMILLGALVVIYRRQLRWLAE